MLKFVVQIQRFELDKLVGRDISKKGFTVLVNLLDSIHFFKVLLLWMLFIMAFGTTFYMIMNHVSSLIADQGS